MSLSACECACLCVRARVRVGMYLLWNINWLSGLIVINSIVKLTKYLRSQLDLSGLESEKG